MVDAPIPYDRMVKWSPPPTAYLVLSAPTGLRAPALFFDAEDAAEWCGRDKLSDPPIVYETHNGEEDAVKRLVKIHEGMAAFLGKQTERRRIADVKAFASTVQGLYCVIKTPELRERAVFTNCDDYYDAVMDPKAPEKRTFLSNSFSRKFCFSQSVEAIKFLRSA